MKRCGDGLRQKLSFQNSTALKPPPMRCYSLTQANALIDRRFVNLPAAYRQIAVLTKIRFAKTPKMG